MTMWGCMHADVCRGTCQPLHVRMHMKTVQTHMHACMYARTNGCHHSTRAHVRQAFTVVGRMQDSHGEQRWAGERWRLKEISRGKTYRQSISIQSSEH